MSYRIELIDYLHRQEWPADLELVGHFDDGSKVVGLHVRMSDGSLVIVRLRKPNPSLRSA